MKTTISPQKIYGLYEIDLEGTIIYARTDHHDALTVKASTLNGRNLFSDVINVPNSTVLRQRVLAFASSQSPADSFDYTLNHAGNQQQKVRVLLAVIRNPAHKAEAKSLIVHIRPV